MIVFRRLLFLGLAACSVAAETVPPSSPADAGEVETPTPGEPDVGDEPDARAPTKDGGKPDASTDILGTLSGACGALKNELGSSAPSLAQNSLAFAAGETYEKASLSTGGQELFDTPNAGGSSVESEVMSFEVLHACEGAKLLKTETEILYVNDDAGPATITDILVEIDGKKVGVSVTRAYKPQGLSFPDSEVKSLVEKKLDGIVRSSQRVAPEDRWVKQILHVFAATKAQADAVVRVLPTINPATRADTIVLLTQTTGGGFVYCNPDPPLGSECP